jgi:L-amino acid N-acyltransferase YncA
VRWLVGQLRAAGVGEIWAAVHPANAPSIALLAALGFVEAEPARALGSYDSQDRVSAEATWVSTDVAPVSVDGTTGELQTIVRNAQYG